MNKKYIIQKSNEFKIIMDLRNIIKNQYFIIYMKVNNLKYNRYGISVSKKIGNAVVRNKIKRQLKEILRKNILNNTKDYVIIVRKEILDLNFIDMEYNLKQLIEKGEYNEKIQ